MCTVEDCDGGPQGRRLVVAPRTTDLGPGDDVVPIGWTAVLNTSGWKPRDELDLHVTGALRVIPRKAPEAIRLKDGSFRGMHLGEGTKDVVRALGRPVRWGGFPDPTGASADEGIPTGPCRARRRRVGSRTPGQVS